MTTTFNGLRDIIVRDFELPPERLTRDTPLEEIELDSLAVTELVFSLEDQFHVTAGSGNLAFKTLGDIADYIDNLIAERDAPKSAPAKSANGAQPTKPGPRRTAAASPKKPASASRGRSASPRKKPGADTGAPANPPRSGRGKGHTRGRERAR